MPLKRVFKEIIILERKSICGIWIIWSGFEDHRKKTCEGTDRELKMTGRNKFLLFRKGFYIIDYLNMLDIQGSIFHGQVINAIIKSNMVG